MRSRASRSRSSSIGPLRPRWRCAPRSSPTSSESRSRASALPWAVPPRAAAVPRDWDHVVHHHAVTEQSSCPRSRARRYYEAAGALPHGCRWASPAPPPRPRINSYGSRCPSATASAPVWSSTAAVRSRSCPRGAARGTCIRRRLPGSPSSRRSKGTGRRWSWYWSAGSERDPERRAASLAVSRSARVPTEHDRRVRPRDPGAARPGRGVEPLRVPSHRVRVRGTRRRHAVAHSREATGTSTSSTACRSTRYCPRAATLRVRPKRAAPDDRRRRGRRGTWAVAMGAARIRRISTSSSTPPRR